MTARPDFGEYGSARFALTSPTCEPRPFRDYVLLPVFLLVYSVVAVATRLAPQAWSDPRPFMCPVCFWSGTWGGLLPGDPDEDGHSDDAVCPRCESYV